MRRQLEGLQLTKRGENVVTGLYALGGAAFVYVMILATAALGELAR
ncbi:hypothetical protein ACMX2H_16130 [Arthrobacter sulfonylureivorans]